MAIVHCHGLKGALIRRGITKTKKRKERGFFRVSTVDVGSNDQDFEIPTQKFPKPTLSIAWAFTEPYI